MTVPKEGTTAGLGTTRLFLAVVAAIVVVLGLLTYNASTPVNNLPSANPPATTTP